MDLFALCEDSQAPEKQRIVVIDCGIGNLASIQNMFKRVGFAVTVSSSPNDVLSADKVVLPGMGSFDGFMSRLAKSGMIGPLTQRVLDEGKPLLGICVGMQALLESSEEGELPGLGWVKGKNTKFKISQATPLRVPHMGWNRVMPHPKSILFSTIPNEPKYYFAHSYHAQLTDEMTLESNSEYGYRFAAALEKKNIFGVQFHPEKSLKHGMALFKNFGNLVARHS